MILTAMPNADVPSSSFVSAASGQPNLPASPAAEPAQEAPREDAEGWVSRALRTLFGWKAGSIRHDLEVVLENGAPADTGFSPEERTMLKNILGLRERRVEDVMLPRADIVAVQQDISLGDLIKVFESAGHSRLAVYNDTLDDPVGMAHIRDLVAYMAQHAAAGAGKHKKPLPANLDFRAVDLSLPLSATKITREVLFVPPSMPVIDLFAKMQATRIHLALVIDEYGGTEGLVSIEDIVEQIVGEIEDEHDEDEAPSVVRQQDGSYLADARATLDDVTAMLGTDFDVGDAAEEVDTLGGYLFMKIGRVPVRGELVRGPGDFEIEVFDADPRRVKRLRIYRRKPAPAEDGRRRAPRSEPAVLPPAAAIAAPPSPEAVAAAREPVVASSEAVVAPGEARVGDGNAPGAH
jgi:CBS domain containing-hemolysin-like protein